MTKIDLFGNKTLLSPELKKYADEKLSKIARYNSEIIGIDLTLEINHHKKEKTAAVAKALVKIPGRDIAAKAEARTIFAAIDILESKLSSQLLKNKNKKRFIKSNLRRGKDKVKRIFRRQ